jgi:hypothetical protein
VAVLLKIRAQGGKTVVAHQHQKTLLGEIGRRLGIEAAGAIFDGIETVGGDRLAHRQPRALEGLRREPFHRITVYGAD